MSPYGWHLGPQRVPVPAVPRGGRARTDEILRRRSFLPPELVNDPAYAIQSPLWDRWFEVEHDARRRHHFAGYAPQVFEPEPEPSDDDWSGDKMDDWSGDEMDLPEVPPPMEAAPAPMEADDGEALQAAIEASELEELGQWPDLAAALRESAEAAAEQERQQREAEGWALYEEAEAWRRQDEADAYNRRQQEEAAAHGLGQASWSPWRRQVEWRPAQAWPQELEAPPTPPAAPAGPPAHLYEVPAYVVLSDDEY